MEGGAILKPGREIDKSDASYVKFEIFKFHILCISFLKRK